jgi:hypothetical protein
VILFDSSEGASASITCYTRFPYSDELRFEWDERKNLNNQWKHGISFETAVLIFEDPNRLLFIDLTKRVRSGGTPLAP